MDESSFPVISLSQYHLGLEARIAVFMLKKLDVSNFLEQKKVFS